MSMYFLLLNLLIIASHAMKTGNKCNMLYGEMDKVMINSQSHKTKYAMDNFYKKRSKQTGMSVSQIKSCYVNKKSKANR